MSSETNVILKYRRPADCWICPDCEAENNMLLATCSVCGTRKDAGAVIIPAWSERDEYVPAPTPAAAPSGGRTTPAYAPVAPSRLGGTAYSAKAEGYASAPAHARPGAYSSPGAATGSGRVFKDADKYKSYEEESSGNTTTIILIVILAVIVGAILLFAASR